MSKRKKIKKLEDRVEALEMQVRLLAGRLDRQKNVSNYNTYHEMKPKWWG